MCAILYRCSKVCHIGSWNTGARLIWSIYLFDQLFPRNVKLFLREKLSHTYFKTKTPQFDVSTQNYGDSIQLNRYFIEIISKKVKLFVWNLKCIYLKTTPKADILSPLQCLFRMNFFKWRWISYRIFRSGIFKKKISFYHK